MFELFSGNDNYIILFVVKILAIVFGMTVHEYAHGLAAYFLGDRTAENQGRLTLNPLAHIDVFGFFMLLLIGFGWAKPVEYNPYALRNQKHGPSIVALAGPLANIVSAFLFLVVLYFLFHYGNFDPQNLLIIFLESLIAINIVLALFNLIPIPPLDGSRFLLDYLPNAFQGFKNFLTQYGQFILIGGIILDSVMGLNILSSFFILAVNWAFSLFF